MMLDVLLALGVLLSTASQLRLPGNAPIGPGEVSLVVWAALMLFRQPLRLTPPLSRLLVFWLIFAFALSVGTLTAYTIGDLHDPDLFLHDAVVYPVLAAVSCLSVSGRQAATRLHRVAWLLVGFGTALLALQLVEGFVLPNGFLVDPWYWDRFRGWSVNPNQLALLCTVLTLLALYLADSAHRNGERIVAVGLAVLPIYVGVLTKADTFKLVLVAASLIFLTLKLRFWAVSREPRLSLRSASSWIAVMAVPLALISAIPLSSVLATQAGNFVTAVGRDNGKAAETESALRFLSWREAVGRGIDSGMLGLGPGPHLEIPLVLVSARKSEALPKYITPPVINGTPNFEAHNTLLDLFTQGGLISVLSFLWISATAALLPYKAQLAGLTTLACGVSIFGATNLIVRHPIFWFALGLCLVAAAGRPTARSVRAWS